jgi:hypothetical protein
VERGTSNVPQYPKDYRVFVNIQEKNNTGKIPVTRKVTIDLSPPDTTPPEIRKVSHDANGPLRTGQKLTVTIEGEPESTAIFDIGGIGKGLLAYDDGKHSDGAANDGKYVGSYTVRAEDFSSGALVTGYLTDKAGNTASLEAANPVDVVGNRPAINSIDHTGRLALGLGEILKVTMVGDPDGIEVLI